MKAICQLPPGETLKARLNQPRISLEELRQQMEEHRRASEEFFKAARKETLKPGPKKAAVG